MVNRVDYFSIICKATCNCNLRCEYCYDKKNREKFGSLIATKEIIDKAAKLISEHSRSCHWLWHGGEPTIIPLEWYDEIQSVLSKHYNTEFNQALQSNGVMFLNNRDLLYKLEEMDIGCGVSFDAFTQSSRMGVNSEKLMDDYCELLIDIHGKQNDNVISALTVVTIKNIDKLIETYEYFKSKFLGYKFALSLLYVNQSHDKDKSLEIPTEILMDNLLKFYNHVFYDTDSNASTDNDMLRLLSSIMYKNNRGSCHCGDCRRSRIGLHPDGEVLYCDTAFEKFPLGNIMDYSSINEIFNSDNYLAICSQIQERYENECYKCAYFEMCGGDCHHQHLGADGNLNKCNKHLCNTLKSRYGLMYNLIQSVDENSSINHSFRLIFETSKSLLPKEIEKFFSLNGVEIDMHVPLDKLDNLGNLPEFKLFRIFTSKESCDKSYLFSSSRFDYFSKILESRKDEIDEVLNEIKGLKTESR